MLNLYVQALLCPLYYIGFFNKRTLRLRERISEGNDIYSFICTSEKPFSWNAGQHGVFSFPDKYVEGKTWRAFSIASSPEEGVMRIATIIKENPSGFKKHLLALEQGESIVMRGPFGEFRTSPKMKHIIGIAGGIGITPFRAIIKSIASNTLRNTKLTLIYSALGAHTFRKEFDTALTHPNIEIIYTDTPGEVNAELKKLVTLHKNTAYYFISGSPEMIGALRSSLRSQGTTKIVSDSFKGY